MKCTRWSGFLVVMLGLLSGVLAADCRAASADVPASATQSSAWKPIPQNGIITASGRYCLKQDIETDRSTGVTINANDVTIDLGGHAIRYTGVPKEGTLGIVAQGQGITITNGTVGGFWFNIHSTQSERLRIRDIRFDDIPYIGINAADSKDVVISDNVFENFRYDLPKAANSTYLIGINIAAKDAVISNNRFIARPQRGTAQDVKVETVFVLFCAEVTKNCIVTKNDMSASAVLPRSYGVWLATNGQATIVDNGIRNMKYGVCLADNASALVCFNRFDAVEKEGFPIESTGITALGAKEIVQIKNTFVGVTTPMNLPKNSETQRATSG